jgi:hypothetical protein
MIFYEWILNNTTDMHMNYPFIYIYISLVTESESYEITQFRATIATNC